MAAKPHQRRGLIRTSIILASACGVLGVMWALQPKEPRYRGKSLSEWLAKLDSGKQDAVDFLPVIDREASDAIRQIGRPAIPFLLQRLNHGLAAMEKYYWLESLPTQIPFRILGPRLDRRAELALEAQLGFAALGEDAADAVPQLTAMISQTQALRTEVIYGALAPIGCPALNVISNAMLNQNRLLGQRAVRAAGRLGPCGASLVPLLVSMLDAPAADGTRAAIAARSLGRIGKPSETIVPALRSRLSTTTNDHLAGNFALGLMLIGEPGREALPEIEAHLAKGDGTVNYFAMLSFVVLATNDTDVARTLARLNRTNAGNESPASNVPLPETLAHVRRTWTNCNPQTRKEMFAMLRNLVPASETN